jgi:sugar phosphate permease
MELDKVFLAPQDSASVNTSPDSLHKHFNCLRIQIIWSFLIIAYFNLYSVRNNFYGSGQMCRGQFIFGSMILFS